MRARTVSTKVAKVGTAAPLFGHLSRNLDRALKLHQRLIEIPDVRIDSPGQLDSRMSIYAGFSCRINQIGSNGQD